MQYSTEQNGDEFTVRLKGRLTFSDGDTFDQILSILENDAITSCVVDFGELEFIDSSGLSMLLLAREITQSRNIKLAFRHARGEVKDRLDFTRFGSIVEIEE